MIKYFNQIITKEGYVLSVDMIRLCFKFKSELDIRAFYHHIKYADLNMMRDFKECDSMTDYSRPPFVYDVYESRSFHYGKYNTLFTIYTTIDKEASISLGIGLQNSKETLTEGFIEFNPNKCHGAVLEWLLNFLRKHCTYLCLKRYDLALDLPVCADEVHLHKDERKYELHRPNRNPAFDTEYLGSRNTTGRFKKYNKKIEHNKNLKEGEEPLEQETTRLEVTLSSLTYNDCIKHFPKIEVAKQNKDLFDYIDFQTDFDNLSATDKVLIKLLNESDKKDIYFLELTRDKKKKLRPFLYGHFFEEVTIHKKDFEECISRMINYCKLFNSNTNKLTR